MQRVILVLIALVLVCEGARAQLDVCPTPALCGTPTMNCPLSTGNTSFSLSTQSCTGPSAQGATVAHFTIGPADICTGPNLSVPCHVVSGDGNFNIITETMSVAAVAVPALSVTALAALVVLLSALALRRLSGS